MSTVESIPEVTPSPLPGPLPEAIPTPSPIPEPFVAPVNPYPDMTLREFAKEFPEVVGHWKMLLFLSGDPAGHPVTTINAFLWNGLPVAAEKISRFMEPHTYHERLLANYVKKPVFEHIIQKYPEIITEKIVASLLEDENKVILRAYVSAIPRAWTPREIAKILGVLDYEDAKHLVEGRADIVAYLFGEGGLPEVACKILSAQKSPEAARTLMAALGIKAHGYFSLLDSPECFADASLYKVAVAHCAPSVPETIAELFARNTPVTQSLLRDPEFAPFKHYLLACM